MIKRWHIFYLILLCCCERAPVQHSSVTQLVSRTWKIAYETNLNGLWQIFIMDSDGSNKKRISKEDIDCMNPVWSPDGKYIAFIGKNKNEYQLYVVEVSRNIIKPLSLQPADIGNSVLLRWFPDNKRIAFLSMETGKSELLEVDIEKGSVRQLTHHHWVRTVTLSPDGHKIALVRFPLISFQPFNKGKDQIILIDVDRKDEKLLYEAKNEELIISLSWSLEGKQIIFSVGVKDGIPIRMVDLQKGKIKDITSLNGESQHCKFSPDGKRIAFDFTFFDKASGIPSITNIIIVNSDGSGLREIATDDDSTDPIWSPDSKSIIFVSGSIGFRQVCIVDIDGKNRKQLTSEHDSCNPSVWPISN